MSGDCPIRPSWSLIRSLLMTALALAFVPTAAFAQTAQEVAAPVLRPLVEAEDAIKQKEPQLAESWYRAALQEGWLLIGALEVADNDLDAARAAYETALVSAVKRRLPSLALAAIEIKTGHPEEAITPLRWMVSMNSLDHQARKLLAQALAANGLAAESTQEMEELRVLFPQDLENLYLLGKAYLQQANIDEAAASFAELAEKRPMPQTHLLIGRAYRDFDQFDRAREEFGQALDMDPQVRRAHYYLGTVELYEKKHRGLTEAMGYLEAELQLAPEDPMANLYLGMALGESRREEEAIPHLEVARRHPATERQALQYLGQAYLRVGRSADAVPLLHRSLELTELTPAGRDAELYDRRLNQIAQLHYQLGRAYRELGDQAAADRHFEAAKENRESQTQDSRERLQRFMADETSAQPQDTLGPSLQSRSVDHLSPEERLDLLDGLQTRLAQVYLNLGVLLAQEQHIPRAADLFQQAADLDSDYPRVQYTLGVARFNSGQFEEATGPLSKALELDPANAELKRMLALAWLNSEHYEPAVELLRDDSERKFDRSLQYAYGLSLVRSGRAIEGQRIFADLLSKYPDWAELNVMLGQALAQEDDYPGAIESLQKAIALQPNVAEAHLTLGEIHLRKGELEAAESELRAEIESHPQDLRAPQLLAMVLDLAGKSEDALQLLEELIDKTPHSADARYLMGKILLAEGNVERATIQLESATRLDPDDPEAHYQLGLALQRQGRREEAKREFDTFQALKRSKNSGESE